MSKARGCGCAGSGGTIRILATASRYKGPMTFTARAGEDLWIFWLGIRQLILNPERQSQSGAIMKILFTEVEPADEPTIRNLCQNHDIQIYGDIPSEDQIIEMADPGVEVI